MTRWICFWSMTQIWPQRFIIIITTIHRSSSSAWAGEVEDSIPGGVWTMTHLTVSRLLNKMGFFSLFLSVQLTFHTCAAPRRAEVWAVCVVVGGEELHQRRWRVCCYLDLDFFYTVLPRLRVPCVFCRTKVVFWHLNVIGCISEGKRG